MSTSLNEISHTTKTVLRQINEILSSVQANYNIIPHSTLNYKYQNFHTMQPSEVPVLKYFGIGIGGCYPVNDSGLVAPYIPDMRDMDLYIPIPLRCVPVDEDLSAAERSNYRMRVRKTIHGLDYFCYYLKLLRIVDTTAQITAVNPVTKLEEPYELESRHLYPEPTIPSTSGTTEGNITEVNVGLKVALDFNAHEIYESINVLYQGDLRYARISEYGIYSGEDRQVTGYDGNNVEMSYIESIYTQLAYKTCNTGNSIDSPSYEASRILLLGNGNNFVI